MNMVRKGDDPNDKHHRYQYLHKAINKHGIDNFSFEIIEENENENFILEKEIFYIKEYESFGEKGYNLSVGGDGPSGYRHTDEAKIKMSKAKKIAFIGEGNPFFGKKHTEETKKKIAEANSRFVGPLNLFYGKKHSEKSLKLMSQNHYNKKKFLTEEEIKEVRNLYATNNYTYKQLGEKYEVGVCTISNIILKKMAYKND